MESENRPWGSFHVLDTGPTFKVKRIEVQPNKRLSLQLHHKRAEVWTVVSGTGRFTIGELEAVYRAGDTVQIPLETKHRMENVGQDMLVVVEVQYGTSTDESDIVRYSDDFGRVQDGNG